MTDYVPLIETTDTDEPTEKPKVDTSKPSAKEKTESTEEPSDSKKLDLLGGLGVAHAENQIELHREMTRVHREVHLLRSEVGGVLDSIGIFRNELDREFTKLIEGVDALLLAEKEAKADLANEMNDTDDSDTVVGRAYGFAVRCAGIGILVWLIAVAIVKVFPEGV